MTILRAMDGKFYDVPEDKVTAYEVPEDKLEGALEKAGMMGAPGSDAPRGGPGGQARGGPGSQPPAPSGAPGPVVVQIFAQPPGAPAQGGPPAPAPSGGQDGDVDPYWGYWWRNFYFVRPWANYYWNNW